MYAVGVGKAVEDELREIASEPVEKHFYYTTDFTAISTIAENLKLNVCPGKSSSLLRNTQAQRHDVTSHKLTQRTRSSVDFTVFTIEHLDFRDFDRFGDLLKSLRLRGIMLCSLAPSSDRCRNSTSNQSISH